MGLDMYLRAKKYVSNFDFYPEEKKLCGNIKEAMGVKGYTGDNNSIEISMTVAYWRKANQIHKWFVDHVQKGTDDCGDYYVERSQLTALRDLCIEVRTTKNAELLPPQRGFFFGSTDVDEYYWDDVEHTENVLTNILNDEQLSKDFSFYYHSSW
jgi:hypothetical protein